MTGLRARRLPALLTIALASAALELHAQPASLPFQDASRPVAERVNDLVARMTLEEKASQMVNRTRAIPRLEVPEYNLWSEALHGVAGGGFATVFPQAIGLSATFDAPLLEEMAVSIAREARVKYNQAAKAGRAGRMMGGLTFYSPNINIFRDPRWGRGQETYGEDPYLAARLGVGFIKGMQGDDPDRPVVTATAKHYAVHSGPEPLRHGFDAKASAHDIEDTYLPAFRAAVVEGKVKSVMCVYNAINGVPGCASELLLDGTLREEWQFEGYVTGDCDAVRDIETGHKYAKAAAEAGAFAVKAGLDNDCTTSAFFDQGGAPDYQRYIDAVKQGLLTEAEIDVALKRMLRLRFELGLFDPPDQVKAAQVKDSELDSPAHRALALKLARESLVLLKNDGVLPFAKRAGADRRRGAAGRQPPRAAGQLQRLALALDDGARGDPEAVPEGARRVRAGHHVPAPRRSRADLGAHHPHGRSRPRGRGVREARLQRDAGRDAHGPAGPRRTRARRRSAAELRRAPAATARPTRWSGFLTASESGTHRLGVEGWATGCSSTTACWSTRPAGSRRPRASRTCRSRKAAATRCGSSRSHAGSPPRASCGPCRSRTSRAAPSRRRAPRTSSSPSSASRPTSRARRTGSTSPASRAATAPASTCRRRSSSCSRPSRPPAGRWSWS